MADAPSRPCRFFCHRCSGEISPQLPVYACPRCGSGFIEELPEQRSSDNGSASTSSTGDQNRPTPEAMVQRHSFTFPSGYGLLSLGVFDENFDHLTQQPTDNSRETDNRREREMALRQLYSTRQPRGQHVLRRQGTRHEGVPTLEGIIQQLVNGIIAPTAMPNIRIGSWGTLHSSPMDYAWGEDGLDTIITQLLNQFENSGPPPADGERINGLPTVSITEEHVGAGLECCVCREEYSIEERVRQLPCSHLFHSDCIIPWLQQHDTCPVCRMSLGGQNTATDPPGLSGMDVSSSSPSSPN